MEALKNELQAKIAQQQQQEIQALSAITRRIANFSAELPIAIPLVTQEMKQSPKKTHTTKEIL